MHVNYYYGTTLDVCEICRKYVRFYRHQTNIIHVYLCLYEVNNVVSDGPYRKWHRRVSVWRTNNVCR